jgi:hypothetical protein
VWIRSSFVSIDDNRSLQATVVDSRPSLAVAVRAVSFRRRSRVVGAAVGPNFLVVARLEAHVVTAATVQWTVGSFARRSIWESLGNWCVSAEGSLVLEVEGELAMIWQPEWQQQMFVRVKVVEEERPNRGEEA